MSRLQGSGPISASDINVELRRAWNAPFSFNDGLTRQLAAKYSGQLNISDFWGRQLYPDRGTPLFQFCEGTTLRQMVHDGEGGQYAYTLKFESPNCGYTPPPPPPSQNYPAAGTVLNQYCEGTTLVTVYADGGGGSNSSYEPNSTACGYFDWGSQG